VNIQLLLTVGTIGFVLLILNAVFLGVIFFMRRKMAAVRQVSLCWRIVSPSIENESDPAPNTYNLLFHTWTND